MQSEPEWPGERELTKEEVYEWLRAHQEDFVETLHILGIPVRDLKDLYRVVQEWRTSGGRPSWLEESRRMWELETRLAAADAVVEAARAVWVFGPSVAEAIAAYDEVKA